MKRQRTFQYAFQDEGLSVPEPEDVTAFVLARLDHLLDRKTVSIFDHSPFAPIISRSMHVRGLIGERMVRALAEQFGYAVTRSKTADLRINGLDVEVKFARQSETGGFTVNQLRPQNYQLVALLVLVPDAAYLFTVPKAVMLSRCTGQRGGAGASETYMYQAHDFAALWAHFGIYSGTRHFQVALA